MWIKAIQGMTDYSHSARDERAWVIQGLPNGGGFGPTAVEMN